MVRNIRRITITTIPILIMIILGLNSSFAEISEDMLSEIMSNKPTELENQSTEKTDEQTDSLGQPKRKGNNKINSTIEASKIIKKNLPLNGEEKAIIEYNKGIEAINRNQEIEAASFFKKALEEFPYHHKARLHLVQLYQKIGWTDEIEKLLQKGLDLNPEHNDFIKNLALLYQQKGQNRKALSILLSMPEAQAHDSEYLSLLALAYLNADQGEMAEKYYQMLLHTNKENAIWWLGLAVSQSALGDYKNAIDSFTQSKHLGRFNTETLDYINNQIEKIKD